MSDINGLLQEINEELQHQKTMDLWKKYGPVVVGGALLIILGTAGFTGWKTYRENAEQRATVGLLKIMTQQEPDTTKRIEALEQFAAEQPGSSQALLGRLDAASLALKEGKTDQAIAIYEALAADQKIDATFRDLAIFRSVQAQMDHGDPAILMARLEPLFSTSTWRFSAKEYAAHLALKINDKEKAKQLFTALTLDQATPPSLKERAEDMLRWMGEGA